MLKFPIIKDTFTTFEYMVLIKKTDRFGVKYYTNEKAELPTFNDISLIRVLNILGDQGWELTVKESDNTYILKRRIKQVR